MLIAWTTLIASGALIAVGFVLGRISAAIRTRNGASRPSTMCSCDHSMGKHKRSDDGNFGNCQFSKLGTQKIHTSPSFWRTESVLYKCSCSYYDGPIPLPTYFDPGQLS